MNTTAPIGALGETRTPDSGLADRRVALTPRTQNKLGPCRTWAAGWLHTDPRGQSGFRSRIKNRRFLKENGRLDGSRTRIPRLERPGSWTVRRQGGKTECDERNAEKQSFGAALLNTHKNENTRPASPFNALRRTACLMQGAAKAALRYCSERCPLAGTRTPHPSQGSGLAPATRCALRRKKEHTPSSLSIPQGGIGLDGRRICTRTLAD